MRTYVKATNWPSRSEAKAAVRANSTKGSRVASKRTYDARMLKATERKIEELKERAERFAARVRCSDALAVVDAERDAATRRIGQTTDTFKHEDTDRYWGNPVEIKPASR